MVDENNTTPSQPAHSGSASGADHSPQANGQSPASEERIAPGPPPAGGEQIRAGDGRKAPAPAAATPSGKPAVEKPREPEIKDGFREIVETIVFVVVLVLLLKAFLAEAFVIPTGSMATTLLGYHRDVQCPKCGYPFRINMSQQVDPDQKGNQREIIGGCTCPNCFFPFNLPGLPEVRQP